MSLGKNRGGIEDGGSSERRVVALNMLREQNAELLLTGRGELLANRGHHRKGFLHSQQHIPHFIAEGIHEGLEVVELGLVGQEQARELEGQLGKGTIGKGCQFRVFCFLLNDFDNTAEKHAAHRLQLLSSCIKRNVMQKTDALLLHFIICVTAPQALAKHFHGKRGVVGSFSRFEETGHQFEAYSGIGRIFEFLYRSSFYRS